MGFMAEFKEFAMKGNVLDMAVGVIIGAAFGSIVTSLVKDVIMPPLGLMLGNVNFSDLFVSLDGKTYATLAEAQAAAAPTINYGLFINTIINFIIVALAIFVVIRQVKCHEAQACTSGAEHEGMPLLQGEHPQGCNQMLALHIRLERIDKAMAFDEGLC